VASRARPGSSGHAPSNTGEYATVSLMNTSVAKSLIGTIRAEKERRQAQLDFEDPENAYEQWFFADEPFINEMCMLVLVAIRHQCERELLRVAASVVNNGAAISSAEYQQNLASLRQGKGWKWKEVIGRLQLGNFEEWNSSMETLRILVNCYKHSPSQQPDEELISHLGLAGSGNYLPLPESTGFREKLAAHLKLPSNADYCDIAEEMLEQTRQFLAKVKIQSQPLLSRVKLPPVSLDPKDFAS